jgi:eukaryotic-like serine/threonine-protein kinase
MALAAGSKLGPYEILGQIGAGGMGEVYRAKDPRLGREVAIKVLPASFSSDSDRLRRFEQEARAAGVLSHPNITAVYDIGTQDGAPYVVQELLEGETLRAVLAAGKPPPRKAIDYATQISHGLAAAHDKGIVHRDLKPENLFVTKDGRLKILDFGLAKLTHQEEGSQATNLPTATAGTEPGVVMGTLGYMSPEQVRGRPADARSDIFSFGAILYEMLSGHRAFHGDSAADTMSAILKEDPPDLSVTNQNVSPGLERVVRHCLEKNPEQRFHSSHDLAFALDALTTASGQGATPAIAAAAPKKSPRALAWTAAGLCVLVAGLAIGRLTAPPSDDPPEITPLTYSGRDSDPAASPDGKTVAFVSERDGKARIWVKQIAGGNEVALTSGLDYHPRFSPDGGSILFTRAFTDGPPAMYRVPIVGGEPRRLIAEAESGDWSPDGRRIVFLRDPPHEATKLCVAASDGGGIRVLAEFQDAHLRHPRWTPDGKAIVVTQGNRGGTAASMLHWISADGPERRVLPLPKDRGPLSSVAWSGGRLVYMQGAQATSEFRSVTGQVLEQTPGAKSARILLNVANFGDTLDILRDGELVFDVNLSRETLREAALHADAAATPRRWITRGQSSDRQPVYSRDGERVVFASDRGGNSDIWEISLKSGDLRRLTDDPAEDWDPGLSPDGRHLLWSSNRSGHFEIWMSDADGSAARQVTHDGVDAENPTMTKDGLWIVYSSSSSDARHGLWKIHPDGSGDTRLVTGNVIHPEVSPGGALVLYHTDGETRVARVSDGHVLPFAIDLKQVLMTRGGRARWTPDGKQIAFLGEDPGRQSVGVYVQDFQPDAAETSSTRRRLAGFDPERETESFGISPDGASILLSEMEYRSDILLATGVSGIRKTPLTK